MFISYSEGFDASTQLKVEKTHIDLACVVNRSRIMYNIPTIIDVLKLEKEFSFLIYDSNKVANSTLVKDRLRMIRIMCGLTEGGTSIEGVGESNP